MVAVRWIALTVGALVVLALLGVGVARLHDGPLGLITGGGFASGEWVDGPVADWSFAKDIETVELQLEGEGTSRTVWIAVAAGRAFVPASLSFPPWKDWHLRAARDGAAVLRIDGRRYPVLLTRHTEGPVFDAGAAAVTSKYTGGTPSGDAWMFAVTSRPRMQ